MNVVVTIEYSTDNLTANQDIATALESFLPYMVDNVKIDFDTEEV